MPGTDTGRSASSEKLRHLPVESGHDYNQPMREALYGWLDRWLRDRGDGSPVPEPAHTTEDPEALRCYPDGPSRPKTIVTIPEFALREGRERLKALPQGAGSSPAVGFGRGAPAGIAPGAGRRAQGHVAPAGRSQGRTGRPPRGRAGALRGRLDTGGEEDKPKVRVLLLRPGGEAAADDPVVAALRGVGRAAVTVDLRATGRGKPETPAVAGVADHNEAEWGLWIGRPLLYQWARDAVAWIDATVAADPLPRRPCDLVGVGPFGVVALIAAALRPGKVARVGLVDPPVSLVGADATPWAKLPMGLLAPNLLDVADVGRLAALVAPARLVVAGGVEPSGLPASPIRRAEAFGFARAVYRLLGSEDRLVLLDSADPSAFVRSLASGSRAAPRRFPGHPGPC